MSAFESTEETREKDEGDDEFWGTALVDSTTGRPSQRFLDLVNSLFIHIDSARRPRNTGLLSPSKLRKDLDLGYIYQKMQIPYQEVLLEGVPTPCLDPGGFLEYILVHIKADPDGAHTEMQKAIRVFKLCDPSTNERFPPLPRSAFPNQSDRETRLLWVQCSTELVSRMKQKEGENAESLRVETSEAPHVPQTETRNMAPEPTRD